MAYQIKRGNRICEELELLDEKDQIVHTLRVYLDVDTMANSLREKQVALTRVQQELQNCKNEDAREHLEESLGELIYHLYLIVFGEENTKIILDFFEGRRMEMNLEINPFIFQVIIPRIQEMVKETRRKADYQYNRKKLRSSPLFHR